MSPPLPPETIDTIINYLSDDRRSLSACSLTCKQLFARSRYHLFSEIHIKSDNIRAFRELLEATSCNIASLVQRLVIHGWEYNDNNETEHMERLSSQLPEVKHLHVVGFRAAVSISMIAAISKLRNVREVVLERVRFHTIDSALAMVYAFPLLERLSLIEPHWNFTKTTPWIYDGSPGQPSFSLGTIQIDSFELNDVINWLLCMRPIPRIQSCSVAYDGLHLLKSVGTSIHVLCLDVFRFHIGKCSYDPAVLRARWLIPESGICTSGLIPFIKVCNCTNVRVLSFRNITTNFGIFKELLSHFPSHCVEELKLEFWEHDGICGFDTDYWSSLASILTGLKFTHLRNIYIQCFNEFANMDHRRMVAHRWKQVKRAITRGPFLEFSRRGTIHFDLGDCDLADDDEETEGEEVEAR
jgi:hypothetical protein